MDVVKVSASVLGIHSIKTLEGSVGIDINLFFRGDAFASSKKDEFVGFVELDGADTSKGLLKERSNNGCYLFRFSGAVKQKFELNMFPFDRQTLAFRFIVSDPDIGVRVGGVALPGSEKFPTFVAETKGALTVDGWQVHEPVVSVETLTEGGENLAMVIVEIPVARHSLFYFLTLTLPSFVTAGLAFVQFLPAVSAAHPDHDALSSSYSLVIAMIALKFVSSQMIPPVSSVTQLDLVLLLCFLALVGAILLSVYSVSNLVNLAVFLAWVGFLVLFHAVHLCTGQWKSWRLGKKDRLIREQREFLDAMTTGLDRAGPNRGSARRSIRGSIRGSPRGHGGPKFSESSEQEELENEQEEEEIPLKKSGETPVKLKKSGSRLEFVDEFGSLGAGIVFLVMALCVASCAVKGKKENGEEMNECQSCVCYTMALAAFVFGVYLLIDYFSGGI